MRRERVSDREPWQVRVEAYIAYRAEYTCPISSTQAKEAPMTKPTKAQLRKAKEHSLQVYRLALEAAKSGNWKRAKDLTRDDAEACLFCRAYAEVCTACVARHICVRGPYTNAYRVLGGGRTPANGIRHFRRTIEQLEALEF